jgi:predicted nucleic acid-binding protein
MNWLLDTNLISETKKSKKSRDVMAWLSEIDPKHMYTSTVNIAELLYGCATLENITKRRDIEAWIEGVVRPWFEDRVFEVSENVLVTWKVLQRKVDLSQNRASASDLLIAAIALENNSGVATRDVKPFVACGLPTLNPWTGERFNGA